MTASSELRPHAVVVQGDTNTALAGGLAANAAETTLVHVESGLRSYDRRMPEEHNRVLVDHMGDLLCAPTDVSRKNLLEEGIPESRIRVTGNTIVEAVLELMPEEVARRALLDRIRAHAAISSCCRRFTGRRTSMIPSASGRCSGSSLPWTCRFCCPLHPRSMARAAEHGMGDLLAAITVVDPIGYVEFLGLGGGIRLPRLRLRRGAGGGVGLQALGDSRASEHRAPRSAGHVRRAGRAGAWHLRDRPSAGPSTSRATSAFGHHPVVRTGMARPRCGPSRRLRELIATS